MTADLLAELAEPEAPTADDTPPRKGRPTTRAGRAEAAAAAKEKRGDRKPGGARNSARASSGAPHVAASVQGLHELCGAVALPMAGMPMTGQALIATGKDAGALWAQLAKRYPAIGKVFAGAGDGALFLQLLMLYAPVVMAGMAERRSGPDTAGNPMAAMFAAGMPSFAEAAPGA